MSQVSQTLLENAFYVVASGILLAMYSQMKSSEKVFKKTHKEVVQVNNAVNRVIPGTATLTDRVDRIEATLVEASFDVGKLKKFTVEFRRILNGVNATIEKVLESHVETRAMVHDVYKSMPKRKDDVGGASE